MDIHVQVNRIELNRVIRDLQRSGKAVGLTVQHVIWEIAALCAQDCVKYTPPRGEVPGTWNQQRKMGNKAVAGDLEKLFADSKDWIRFDTGGKHFARKKGERKAFEIEADHLTDDLETVHKRFRGSRGHVNRQPLQYWVKPGRLGEYTKKVQGRVGSLKAGWLRGLYYFSAKAMKSPNVPDWVRNQIWAGESTDAVSVSGSGFVKIENTAHHRGAIRDDMVAFIQRKRQGDADKWIYKRLNKIAARFNGGATTGQRETA